MIFAVLIEWCLVQLSSEGLHPATDGNIRQTSENPVEEEEEGSWEPEGPRTPQENPVSITWAHRGS